MNMHGIMIPHTAEENRTRRARVWEEFVSWARRSRYFLLFVVLPTALVGGYFYLIAADRYKSEAHFLVRAAGQPQTPGIGLSAALSAVTGTSAAQSEAMSVADYLSSHDAVDTLRSRFGLVARFQRPGVDLLSRLLGENPSPERLLKFYNRHVKVKYNSETGITTLAADTFMPQDSYDLVQELLALGERRVNVLNERSYRDSISMARQQLDETENLLTANQQRMTQYRQSRRDIDPQSSGTAQLSLVTNLTSVLATAKAQLQAMGKMIDHRSPQYLALEQRVRALEAQVSAQSSRLTGSGKTIASDIGGYEDLRMRQGFLMKRYESAAAALDRARDQAQRQQLYIVRVVQPNMPVKSLLPERGRITLTVFLGLLVIYAIGWLIAAGMKEHAA